LRSFLENGPDASLLIGGEPYAVLHLSDQEFHLARLRRFRGGACQALIKIQRKRTGNKANDKHRRYNHPRLVLTAGPTFHYLSPRLPPTSPLHRPQLARQNRKNPARVYRAAAWSSRAPRLRSSATAAAPSAA